MRTAEEGHAVVGAEEDGVHVGMTVQQLLERRVHARVLSNPCASVKRTVSCACGTTDKGTAACVNAPRSSAPCACRSPSGCVGGVGPNKSISRGRFQSRAAACLPVGCRGAWRRLVNVWDAMVGGCNCVVGHRRLCTHAPFLMRWHQLIAASLAEATDTHAVMQSQMQGRSNAMHNTRAVCRLWWWVDIYAPTRWINRLIRSR